METLQPAPTPVEPPEAARQRWWRRRWVWAVAAAALALGIAAVVALAGDGDGTVTSSDTTRRSTTTLAEPTTTATTTAPTTTPTRAGDTTTAPSPTTTWSQGHSYGRGALTAPDRSPWFELIEVGGARERCFQVVAYNAAGQGPASAAACSRST